MKAASLSLCYSILVISMQLRFSLGQRILGKDTTSTCRMNYNEAAIEQRLLEKMRPAFVSLVSSMNSELSAKIDELTRQLEKLANESKEATLQCPGREWKVFGNACFLFSNTTATWDNARVWAHCKTIDSDLVSITSLEENVFIKTYLKTIPASAKMVFWTSGKDISEKGTWKWTAINEIIDYQDWAPGQPNGGESCLALGPHTGFSWHDYGCTGTRFFICETGQTIWLDGRWVKIRSEN